MRTMRTVIILTAALCLIGAAVPAQLRTRA